MQNSFEKIALGKKSLSAFSYEIVLLNGDSSTILYTVNIIYGSKILTKIHVSVPVNNDSIQALEKTAMEVICRFIAGNGNQPDPANTGKGYKKEYKSNNPNSNQTKESVNNLFSSLNL